MCFTVHIRTVELYCNGTCLATTGIVNVLSMITLDLKHLEVQHST